VVLLINFSSSLDPSGANSTRLSGYPGGLRMPNRTQVIIVGGGPVGVGLAVELGLRGISCTLVERYKQPQQIPKGQNLTQRTLEHFYFWGIVDELRASRTMPNDYPIGSVTAYKNMMSDYWYAPPGRELVRPYYFEENDRLPQYSLERVLRDKMARLPTVKTMFGWDAESIRQDANGVTVTVVDRPSTNDAQYAWAGFQDAVAPSLVGGRPRQTLEADFVVGCDGTRSQVREQMGINRSGSDFDQKMLLAVFRSKELHEAFKRFPDRTTYRAMDPELQGYWMFFGRVDVGESWFFHAPVPLDTTTENYDFQALLNRAAGFEFTAEFDHVGFWDLKIAVADEYQVGRVFIAGDAAHSHPPYGGYGLNSGLEDITNLGWKLAAVLDGWGGPSLLSSYSEERRPIFWETAEDFIADGINKDREFLNAYNPDRDEAEFAAQWEANSTASRVATYEPNYEGSAIVDGPMGGTCSAHGSHTFIARAGHHLPPQLLSASRQLSAELGTNFSLLAFGAGREAITAFQASAAALSIPLVVIEDSFDGGREQYASRLILVRPDQYIVWAGDYQPADVDALFKKVAGQA
jgi:2-polyprenyl-6-methoxyphenol hydroxylase-like FAD-dependent oxidoreductase